MPTPKAELMKLGFAWHYSNSLGRKVYNKKSSLI